MRIIGYGLAAIFFFGVLIGLGWLVSLLDLNGDDDQNMGYRQVNTYELTQDGTLKFNYTQASASAKLLLHVVLSEQAEQSNQLEPLQYNYTIEYRLSGQQQFTALLLTTQIQQRVDEVSGELTPAYKLIDGKKIVSDSRGLELALPKAKKKSLQLRLKSNDPKIEKVIVRSFYKEGLELKNSDLKWARLGKWERSRLARFHPFGRNYLSKQEVRNVLSNRNQALAPSGIAGDDFRIVPLLVHDDPDTLIATDTGLQGRSGANFGGDLIRSLRVLKTTTVNFSVQTTGQANSTIDFVLRNQGNQVTEGKIALDGKSQVSQVLVAGDYVFSAQNPMWLEVEVTDDIETAEVRRKFHAISQHGLNFPLSRSDYATQILRLETLATPEQPVTVAYSFYDESNSLISQGQITHAEPLDGANRIDGQATKLLSVIRQHVMQVPSTAHSIELNSSDADVLVRLSNSLESLASKVSVNQQGTTYSSNWFSLEPSKVVPPLQQPDAPPAQQTSFIVVSSGRYHFDEFQAAPQVQSLVPSKFSPVIRVLEPIELTQSEGETSPIIFSELKPNVEHRYSLQSSNEADDSVVQSAIYFNQSAKQHRITLLIDERAYSYDLSSAKGMISFPSLDAGEHSIRWSAPDGVRMFTNYISVGEQATQRYKMRSLYRVVSKQRFAIEHAAVSNMTLQLIMAVPKTLRQKVSLNLVAVRETDQRQFRKIEIDPAVAVDAINLDTDAGLLMFVPVYVPLAELEGYSPTHFDVDVNTESQLLISLSLLDSTGAFFNRQFIDKVSR